VTHVAQTTLEFRRNENDIGIKLHAFHRFIEFHSSQLPNHDVVSFVYTLIWSGLYCSRYVLGINIVQKAKQSSVLLWCAVTLNIKERVSLSALTKYMIKHLETVLMMQMNRTCGVHTT